MSRHTSDPLILFNVCTCVIVFLADFKDTAGHPREHIDSKGVRATDIRQYNS